MPPIKAPRRPGGKHPSACAPPARVPPPVSAPPGTGKGLPIAGKGFPTIGGHLPHRRQALAGDHPARKRPRKHPPHQRSLSRHQQKVPARRNPSGDFVKHLSAFAIRSASNAKRRCSGADAVYAAFLAFAWLIRVLAPLTASTIASTNSSTASRACRQEAKISPPFMISSIFA